MGKRNSSGKKRINRKAPEANNLVICVNRDCKLRIKGCKGFEGCPGYKGKG